MHHGDVLRQANIGSEVDAPRRQQQLPRDLVLRLLITARSASHMRPGFTRKYGARRVKVASEVPLPSDDDSPIARMIRQIEVAIADSATLQ
jgi:hypothetical protein